MRQFDLLKHDVRVRERMLHKGMMTEAEWDSHLSGLPDLESQCDRLPLQQPALSRFDTEPSSERLTPATAPSFAAPSFESARVVEAPLDALNDLGAPPASAEAVAPPAPAEAVAAPETPSGDEPAAPDDDARGFSDFE